MFDPHFPQSGRLLWHRAAPHATARTRWHHLRGYACTSFSSSRRAARAARRAASTSRRRNAAIRTPAARRARSLRCTRRGASFRWPRRRRLYTRRSSPSSFAAIAPAAPLPPQRQAARAAVAAILASGVRRGSRRCARPRGGRRARADCWIGAWRQPQPRGPLDRPPPLVLVVSRRRRPPPPPRCPALCPTSTSAARASSTRRCCGSRWSPTILSRALSSPRRSIAHVTRSSSRCGARSRRTAAAEQGSGCAAA